MVKIKLLPWNAYDWVPSLCSQGGFFNSNTWTVMKWWRTFVTKSLQPILVTWRVVAYTKAGSLRSECDAWIVLMIMNLLQDSVWIMFNVWSCWLQMAMYFIMTTVHNNCTCLLFVTHSLSKTWRPNGPFRTKEKSRHCTDLAPITLKINSPNLMTFKSRHWFSVPQTKSHDILHQMSWH